MPWSACAREGHLHTWGMPPKSARPYARPYRPNPGPFRIIQNPAEMDVDLRKLEFLDQAGHAADAWGSRGLRFEILSARQKPLFGLRKRRPKAVCNVNCYVGTGRLLVEKPPVLGGRGRLWDRNRRSAERETACAGIRRFECCDRASPVRIRADVNSADRKGGVSQCAPGSRRVDVPWVVKPRG